MNDLSNDFNEIVGNEINQGQQRRKFAKNFEKIYSPNARFDVEVTGVENRSASDGTPIADVKYIIPEADGLRAGLSWIPGRSEYMGDLEPEIGDKLTIQLDERGDLKKVVKKD